MMCQVPEGICEGLLAEGQNASKHPMVEPIARLAIQWKDHGDELGGLGYKWLSLIVYAVQGMDATTLAMLHEESYELVDAHGGPDGMDMDVIHKIPKPFAAGAHLAMKCTILSSVDGMVLTTMISGLINNLLIAIGQGVEDELWALGEKMYARYTKAWGEVNNARWN